MLRIISSSATEQAQDFQETPRHDGEGNVAWLRRQFASHPELTEPVSGPGAGASSSPTLLLLLGGRSSTAFRVRVAQSHLRHDLTPSQWSHTALLWPLQDGELGEGQLWEISLEPPDGFGFPTPQNALQQARASVYDDATRYPNIALLRVPVPSSAWTEPTPEGEVALIDRFRRQRAMLDATELLLDWLAFVWGVGRAGNPLLEGRGLPSAAMVETILIAAGYDITPGLESRASCPEAIWQAARWWHTYYEDSEQGALVGRWHVGHRIAHYDGAEARGA